jgi:hypothetical protein
VGDHHAVLELVLLRKQSRAGMVGIEDGHFHIAVDGMEDRCTLLNLCWAT